MSNFKEDDSIRYISNEKHGDGKSQHGGTVAVYHERGDQTHHVATATHLGGREYKLTPHNPKYDNHSDRATIMTGLQAHHDSLKDSNKWKNKEEGSSMSAVHSVNRSNIGMPPLKLDTKHSVKSLSGKKSTSEGMSAGMAAKLKNKTKKSDSSFNQSLSKMDKLIEMTEELVKSRYSKQI